jgi:hypothetical protein
MLNRKAATLKEGDDDKSSTDLEITMAGEVKTVNRRENETMYGSWCKKSNILSNSNWKPSEKFTILFLGLKTRQ